MHRKIVHDVIDKLDINKKSEDYGEKQFKNYPELNDFYDDVINNKTGEYAILYDDTLLIFDTSNDLIKYRKKT